MPESHHKGLRLCMTLANPSSSVLTQGQLREPVLADLHQLALHQKNYESTANLSNRLTQGQPVSYTHLRAHET